MKIDTSWAKNAILRCKHCRFGLDFTGQQARVSLSAGWLKCCGETMTLITEKERVENGQETER